MNQTKSAWLIGGIGAAIGGLDWLWSLIGSIVPLPENFVTLPGWAKVLALVIGVGGLVLSSIKTSQTNPDGTPATEKWIQ